jgi:paraquat-inducible protein A
MIKKTLTVTVLFLSMACFVLGLMFPILSTKQQVIGITLKYREIKLFDSVCLFYKEHDWFLAFAIFAFTVIFPVIKYIDLTVKVFVKNIKNIKYKKLSAILQQLDKWSMLDVFLVALLLLNFKMDSNIIVMKLKLGTTFIALSVICRIISVHFINNIKTKEL